MRISPSFKIIGEYDNDDDDCKDNDIEEDDEYEYDYHANIDDVNDKKYEQ